jgi:hypothetical protein
MASVTVGPVFAQHPLGQTGPNGQRRYGIVAISHAFVRLRRTTTVAIAWR